MQRRFSFRRGLERGDSSFLRILFLSFFFFSLRSSSSSSLRSLLSLFLSLWTRSAIDRKRRSSEKVSRETKKEFHLVKCHSVALKERKEREKKRTERKREREARGLQDDVPRHLNLPPLLPRISLSFLFFFFFFLSSSSFSSFPSERVREERTSFSTTILRREEEKV